jgi:hypothetical protein
MLDGDSVHFRGLKPAFLAFLAVIHKVTLPRDHLHATRIAAAEELLAAMAVPSELGAVGAKHLVAGRTCVLHFFATDVT